ncbi:serpin family protein [Pyrococcus kukulkanii]|uniref:serpin family protein n=1 Tax=Pyrococcus kukulkanii TaxID=1609559 RepID=UPI003569F614
MYKLIACLLFIIITAGCLGNETAIPPGEGYENVVEANNNFAVNLYRAIGGKDNLVISPLSVFLAFSMLYEGSEGETKAELEKVFGFPSNEKMRGDIRNLLLNLTSSKNFTLDIANAIWIREGAKPEKEYVETIRKYYQGEIREVDFLNDPMGAAREINSWVREKTRGKIEKIVDRLDSDTYLIITNAIYLNATWIYPFTSTFNSTFTTFNGVVQVEMMKRMGKFNYYEDDVMQIIELPYKGNLSMIVILPKKLEDFEKVEKSIDANLLKEILEKMKKENVMVYFPKFKMKKFYNLNDALARLGLKSVFTELDIPKIAPEREKEDLCIDRVLHKTFIKVDEKGTEAAAATAIIVVETAMPVEVKEFKADHPFIFFIIHKPTGAIIFMGRIANPSEGSP